MQKVPPRKKKICRVSPLAGHSVDHVGNFGFALHFECLLESIIGLGWPWPIAVNLFFRPILWKLKVLRCPWPNAINFKKDFLESVLKSCMQPKATSKIEDALHSDKFACAKVAFWKVEIWQMSLVRSSLYWQVMIRLTRPSLKVLRCHPFGWFSDSYMAWQHFLSRQSLRWLARQQDSG